MVGFKVLVGRVKVLVGRLQGSSVVVVGSEQESLKFW